MAELENIVPLLKEDKTLTPYIFYTDFIKSVANVYLGYNSEKKGIQLRLVEGDDIEFSHSRYFIDPIALPLLLSLFNQLKAYHKRPIKLHLSNTPVTINILEYLFRSDFFYIVGSNSNPSFPIGKRILDFDEAYLGGFRGKSIRSDHKLRCYSLADDNLNETLLHIGDGEPAQRDFLVEFYTYKVKDHFYDLLFENRNSSQLTNEFIEIFAELITNGVLHSKSDAFALMFKDRFKTKFSISDNGIGLYESLRKKKDDNKFYLKFALFEELAGKFQLKTDERIKNSVLVLFETLYYSMLKDRQGLFDLMCNVVINCGGYFRLHTDNAQIIVSARMLNELIKLNGTREKIIQLHNSNLFQLIGQEEYLKSLGSLVQIAKAQIVELANSIFKKYTEDTRFSALRLFEVKFRGVHIEVEIPNSNENS